MCGGSKLQSHSAALEEFQLFFKKIYKGTAKKIEVNPCICKIEDSPTPSYITLHCKLVDLHSICELNRSLKYSIEDEY